MPSPHLLTYADLVAMRTLAARMGRMVIATYLADEAQLRDLVGLDDREAHDKILAHATAHYRGWAETNGLHLHLREGGDLDGIPGWDLRIDRDRDQCGDRVLVTFTLWPSPGVTVLVSATIEQSGRVFGVKVKGDPDRLPDRLRAFLGLVFPEALS